MTQPKHTVKSIDALINNIPEAQPINYQKPPVTPENIENKPDFDEKPAKIEVKAEENENNDDFIETPVTEARKAEKSEKPENTETSSNVQQNDGKIVENAETPATEVDEYGNPLPPPKMYTEDQVQKMMRERLKRGAFRQEPAPSQQQLQQAEDTGFQYNENSELSWSQQLKQFVKSTMQEVKKEEYFEHKQAAEKQANAEFEAKFHTGMSKYADFIETMADKTITDDMVMATRGLTNPAGFLYAAAKKAPQELHRIAKIADPYQQVAEMGRLHEKLAKRKPSSNAPRPLTPDRNDVFDKPPARVSIDHLIHEDAAKRYRR